MSLGVPENPTDFYAMTPLLPGVKEEKYSRLPLLHGLRSLIDQLNRAAGHKGLLGTRNVAERKWAIKTAPGCLGFIGDAKTTQVYRDYKSIIRFPIKHQVFHGK